MAVLLWLTNMAWELLCLFIPPVNSADTALQSNLVLATYVTLYLSVISCLSSLLSVPVCLSQTGRLPHWPCCWGGRPSPCSPSLWR